MDVPIKSNGEINFQNLESLARNHICTNPYEHVFELDADAHEKKKVVNYFTELGDFKVNYNKNGGNKYEIKISADI